MNKLLTKVAKLALGLSLAAGVGVAVGSNAKKVEPAEAATQQWELVTAAPSDWSGEYILCNGTSGTVKYLQGSTFSSSSASGVDVTVSSSKITVDDSNALTIAKSSTSGKYTIQINGKYVGRNANSNGMDATDTWSTSYDNTISYGSSKVTIAGNGGRTLTWYASNSNFRYYASSNNCTQLFKKVAAKTLSGITVKTAPTKTTYYAGEYFDPTGLELTATYSDSSTATIDYATYGADFTFTPTTSTALTTSNDSVTIGYGGKTTTQAITVNAARTLSSISVSGYTSTFDQGDTFAFGGTVTAHYSNSTTENVTASATFSGYNLAETGNQTVTVSYTEGGTTKTTTYSITVNAVSSVTFVAGTDKSDSTSLTKKGVTISVSSGTLSRDDNYRVYANNSLTISSTIGKIKSISLALVSGNHGDYSSSYDNVNNTSWTESTTTQARITQIDVEIMPSTPAIELDKNSLDLKTNESSGKTVKATIYNVDNPTIVWTPNNENVTIETGSIVGGEQTATIKPNTNVAANTTIAVTVTGTSLSATISVSITVPGPGETADTAFTVSQARTHIDSVVTGGESSGNDGNYYYAAGIVSAIVTPYDSTYHNISYTISADGLTTSAQLEAYRGKGLNGANFTSDDDIAVGDQVVIYGQLKIYNGTYEFDANNYLVSRIAAPQAHSITFTPSVVEVAPDDAGDIVDLFTSIVINQDTGANKTVSDIVWSSGDANVFYVDGDEYLVAGAHKDSTTLYASIGGKQLGSATIEIVDPDHPFIVYDVPEEWTIVTDASTLQAGDQIIITDEDSTVGMLAYSSGNNCKDTSADGETAITVSGSKMTNTGTAGILTLSTANSSDGTFYLNDGSHYLYAASNSGNQLKGKNSTDSSNGAFKFSYSSTMTIYAYGSSNRNYICYNDTNALFSCYASDKVGDYKGLQVYKKSGGNASTLDLDNTILNLVHSHMATYKDEHNNDQYGIAVCDYNGATLDKNDWDDMGSDFTSSIINTYKLNYARSNASGNDVEKFLSAYDYVVAKYGSAYDFLGRIATGKVTVSGGAKVVLNNVIGGNTNTIAAIVVISLVSVTAIGGYFFFKRRQEN